MRKLLPLLAFLLIIFSCKKDKQKYTGTEKVEFYLLATVKLVPNKCAIDGSQSTLEASPLITNNEIEGYDTKEHEFKLSASGWEKMEVLKDKVYMAVTVNKQVVYYAIFKPNYSSSSCDHSITVDVRPKLLPYYSENRVCMSLGYPGDNWPGIDDKRNDAVLLNVLQAQGKLL